jgi:hypothetical protein
MPSRRSSRLSQTVLRETRRKLKSVSRKLRKLRGGSSDFPGLGSITPMIATGWETAPNVCQVPGMSTGVFSNMSLKGGGPIAMASAYHAPGNHYGYGQAAPAKFGGRRSRRSRRSRRASKGGRRSRRASRHSRR